jgi:hypothetical protein
MVRRSFRPFFISMLLFVAFATANARQMKAKSDSHQKNMALSATNVAPGTLHKLPKPIRTDTALAPTPVVLKLPGIASRRQETKTQEKVLSATEPTEIAVTTPYTATPSPATHPKDFKLPYPV